MTNNMGWKKKGQFSQLILIEFLFVREDKIL